MSHLAARSFPHVSIKLPFSGAVIATGFLFLFILQRKREKTKFSQAQEDSEEFAGSLTTLLLCFASACHNPVTQAAGGLRVSCYLFIFFFCVTYAEGSAAHHTYTTTSRPAVVASPPCFSSYTCAHSNESMLLFIHLVYRLPPVALVPKIQLP